VALDPRSLGAQELLLALFRLAVCDLRGLAYGHDEPASNRRVRARHNAEAATFLRSVWASELADLAGLPIVELRQRAFRTVAEAAEQRQLAI
jgi:hypothetical protein